jgi:excisionase family DNA binding protein
MSTLSISGEPPIAPPLLVSEREAGRLLGVTARTVYELRRRGRLRCVRIGARVLYSRAELIEFCAAARQTGGAQ